MRLIDADAIQIPSTYVDMFENCRNCKLLDREQVLEIINSAPSIDIEPKRGEWIDMGDFEQCSACKGTHLKEFQSYYGKTTWIKTPYCPHCGARMKGADDE